MLNELQHSALDALAERQPGAKVIGTVIHHSTGKTDTIVSGFKSEYDREKARLAPKREPIIRYESGALRRLTIDGKLANHKSE